MARVLIVDDFEGKRSWMRAILEASAHTVAEAANGSEALGQLASGPFDMVVTDINMPTMNGIELIDRLRSRQGQRIKILAVSAGSDELPSDIALQSGKALGADATLYLPCKPAELIAAVNSLLAK